MVNEFSNQMMRQFIKIMKKSTVFLTILGLIGAAFGLSFANKAKEVKATTIVDAGKAWTYESTTSSALYFKMANNDAPYNTDWSVRYKPVTVDSLVIIRSDASEHRLPQANLNAYEAICKFNTDSYFLEQWFFNDGTTGKIQIGDTVEINGDFNNASKDITIRISHSEFYVASTSKVITFNAESNEEIRDEFLGRFQELFDYEIYDPNDVSTLREIEATLVNSIMSANSMRQVYPAYDSALSQASAIEKSAEGFLNYQESKKEEIRNYVSLDDYLDEQKTVVQGIIDDCCTGIDAATTTSEIKALLAKAKEDIDAVQTRLQYIENKVINREAGYKKYLQSYDQITLNDLALGESQTFHGLKAERGDDINTNVTEGNLYNTFVPNPTNEKGNVIFNFSYQSNCKTNYGANMFVNLRGVKYYGYKFAISTDSQGMYFSRVFSNESTFVWGNSNYLTNQSKTYNISIGAIDLVEGDRTWIFIDVDGGHVYSAMTNSHPTCVNPRVSLSNNDDERGDKAGITTIGNYYPADYESKISPIYGGIFKYEEGHSDITSNLYLNLEENAVKSDINKKLYSYANKPENIKLIRGANEYNLATSNIPVIAKYGETKYQLFLSSLLTGPVTTIEENDKLVISGAFTYFDSEEGRKYAYEIMESTFVYSSSGWTQELSLNAYKQDAIRKVNSYLSSEFLANYDLEEQNAITAIVNVTVDDINDAGSISTVDNLYASFKSQVGAILTSLKKYQEGKVSSLDNYINGKQNLYKADDWAEIISYRDEYVQRIRGSESKQDADNLYNSAIKLIDSVLTIEEHNAQDLKDAKYQAVAEVKNHYGSLDLNAMSDSEVATLNADTRKAISDINNANNIEEVNSILNNYKTKHPLPETNPGTDTNQKKKCGGSIVISSALLSLLSLSGIGLLLYRKNKMED